MSESPKHAQPDHPIHDLIASRFSPYAYDPRPVDRADLLSCLEAARWSASSYNEQPWSFLVAERTDEAAFGKMLGCLVEGNRGWARSAGVLIVTVVSHRFTRNDKPNRAAEHDMGLAVGNLVVEATSRGLHVHQMAGIDLDATREAYAIPDGHSPLTAIALGHAADPATFPDESLRQRDVTPRSRKPLADFVFAGAWGESASLDA